MDRMDRMNEWDRWDEWGGRTGWGVVLPRNEGCLMGTVRFKRLKAGNLHGSLRWFVGCP